MNNIINNFETYIIDQDKLINSQIIGLKYLELIKNKLIQEILIKENKDILDPIKKINNKLDIKELVNKEGIKLSYNIEFFNAPESLKNYKIENDMMILIFQGFVNLEITDKFEKEKKIKFKLSKNSGIVISKDTIISREIPKETILISFFIE